MVVSLINLYMHGHLISEHWTWHISASSVVGCSLTDDYWIMHIHDVRNSSTQDYLAVLIDLISALFFTQLPGPEFCPVVSCCIGRREGQGRRHVLLLPEMTAGDTDGCAGHTQSLKFLLTAITTLTPFLPWAVIFQAFNAPSSSVSQVQGKIFLKSESLS